jgi:hypothetical protein
VNSLPLADAAYEPRSLTRKELLRRDIYFFESPKLRRRITVVGPAALAAALEYEFNPQVELSVERPRRLAVESIGNIELSFWTRLKTGFEQLVLLTAFAEGPGGEARRDAGRREDIAAAARNAGLTLTLVAEKSFLPRAVANANRARVLPYVQCAAELTNADLLRDRIRELFVLQPRNSFQRIEYALSSFDPRDVRAVTCELIHGGHLQLDWSTRLHVHTVVSAGGAR